MRPSIRPRPFVTFLPIASKKYLEVLLWVVSRDTARLRDDVLILSLRGGIYSDAAIHVCFGRLSFWHVDRRRLRLRDDESCYLLDFV